MDYVFRAFLRQGVRKGRAFLEELASNNFEALEQSGRVLTNTTVNGESLTWTVPPGLSTMEIVSYAERALEYLDGHSDAQVRRVLRGGAKVKVIRFLGGE
ncbi:hypothetical protein DB346_02380 [Verrucomicrobia bacterium LW23]|nr:hypothetical protein DB346_02380 [Verrucomicrobia bacterium LW23]